MRITMRIGDLECEIPVIQGGMGVGVSLSGLAGAVASAGGVGIISTAQIGYRDPDYRKNPTACNLAAIREEIKKARQIAPTGVIGVNIMVVTKDYERYVKAAVEAGADLIISGAGLPMELPGLTQGSSCKLVPIVSSARALKVILRYWQGHYNRKPDAVVVEGPMAGGHLGFSMEELERFIPEIYDQCIQEIIALASKQEIPVIVAGGVYTGEDLDHYLAMGAAGVQVATRFVTTEECDAHPNYKKAYLDARKEDIVIVKSPVGMPGRAIRNAFLDRVGNGERVVSTCKGCITTCNPATTPYCITDALISAVEGRCDEGLLFCGSNAYRATKIERVADIMEEFRR